MKITKPPPLTTLISDSFQFLKNAFNSFPSIESLPLPRSEENFFKEMKQVFANQNNIPSEMNKNKDEEVHESTNKTIQIDHIPFLPILPIFTPKSLQNSICPLIQIRKPINHAPFEPWEDDIIRDQQSKQGNRWKIISQLLPNRTPHSIKNRWYTVLKYLSQGQKPEDKQKLPVPNEIKAQPPSQPEISVKTNDQESKSSLLLLDMLKQIQKDLHSMN